MSGNPWFRKFIERNMSRNSYNYGAERHVERMQELSALETEKQWLERRMVKVTQRISEIENSPWEE